MTRTREENAIDLMHEDTEMGLQVTAYFRNLINAELNVPWKECERIGEIFNAEVEDADWLSTDTGRMFELTFVPRSGENVPGNAHN